MSQMEVMLETVDVRGAQSPQLAYRPATRLPDQFLPERYQLPEQ
jgi:hypothetical protein